MREHVYDLPLEESEVAKVLVNNACYAGKKLTTDVRCLGGLGDRSILNFGGTL